MSEKSFIARVRNTTLTKTEQIIAEYVLHNYSTVGFMTSTEIAEKLGVSEASVIRMSRSLGYEGFNGLKSEIKLKMSERLKTNGEFEYSLLSPNERLAESLRTISSGDITLTTAERAIASIEDVMGKNNSKGLKLAADILQNSRRKYICGFRSTAFVAEFFAFALQFSLSDVTLSTNADAKALEGMMDISEEDCVVLFAYPRYSKINFIVKQRAKDAGAKVVVIIDRISSELASGADVVLSCNPKSLSYYNSILPMVFICEVILAELSKSNAEFISERLELLGEYIDTNELY